MYLKAYKSKYLKQSRSLSYIIISRMRHNSPTLQRRAFMPLQNNSPNLKQSLEPLPPIKSRYSVVNLNGDFQKFIFPGANPKINPKSIWIICPSISIRILPLCRSLSFSTQVIREAPTREERNLSLASFNFISVLNISVKKSEIDRQS